MSKKQVITLLWLIIQAFTLPAFAAIGDWKAYMAYSEVQEIEQAGNLIFVQASNNLYAYNPNDQSIQTFSKINYLSDCNIRHIAYNKTAKRLLILYGNGNIDLMNVNNFHVNNLPDYYDASITGDKDVNDIYMDGKYAYLSNGFGIVKVNVSDGEISDTYNLGFQVNWCEIKNNFIYAYSQPHGQYRASLSQNLLDKNNWSLVGGYVSKTQEDQTELKKLVSTLQPDGPKYNHFWYMKFANNQLYTCGGAFLSGLSQDTRPGTIQVLNNDQWQIYQDDVASVTGYPYQDINCVEPDANNPQHVFASGRTGLYEFTDGKLTHYYNKDNSLLEGAVDGNQILGNDYVLVHSLLSDKSGSLWVLNSQASHRSILERKDNEWKAHDQAQLMEDNYSFAAMTGLMQDKNGVLWFVNDNHQAPAIVCYQPQTNELQMMKKPFSNQDGVSIDLYYIKCIKEDLEHNLWVGTDQGPFYITQNTFASNSPTLTQVKVPRNDGTNYADYLLSGVDITCIAIDAANRKWFGTSNNGVYLISADNMEQIEHFTTSNSPLLSNNIESLAINDATGEVFIGTNQGLCSYMSDATATSNEMTKDNVWAYPNPVKPDYTGLITITGLTFDADVKIVSTNGSLVNQGRSNGGTYTWDGNDLKGRRVASGIYMVETATSNGSQGTVCKIAIIR